MLPIPRCHIVCTLTLGSGDPELLAKARAEGRLWDIDTGHDLLITEPEAVADRLLRVASERARIVRVTPRDLLDPEIAKAIEGVPFDEITAEILPSLRRGRRVVPALSDAVERIDHVVPGGPEVRVRVHRAKETTGVQPCVYSMHGGGYVIGTNATDDPLFDELCPKLGLVGVSVEYRLAPRRPTRGRCWTATRTAMDVRAPDELGIDPRCIGVMGVSAGGPGSRAGPAGARPRRAAGGVPAPRLGDARRPADHAVEPTGRLPVWNRNSNSFGWRSYLGDLSGPGDVPDNRGTPAWFSRRA